jgi:hypothetical protein
MQHETETPRCFSLSAEWLQPYGAAICQYAKDFPSSSDTIIVSFASIGYVLVELSRVEVEWLARFSVQMEGHARRMVTRSGTVMEHLYSSPHRQIATTQ